MASSRQLLLCYLRDSRRMRLSHDGGKHLTCAKKWAFAGPSYTRTGESPPPCPFVSGLGHMSSTGLANPRPDRLGRAQCRGFTSKKERSRGATKKRSAMQFFLHFQPYFGYFGVYIVHVDISRICRFVWGVTLRGFGQACSTSDAESAC